MLAGNTDCRRSVIIAQREPGSDLEVFPTAGGDRGNPREFWEKRSGESGKIHPVSCHCRPHTRSGSRTAQTGGHKLERVCDLLFSCVGGGVVRKLTVGGVARRSPHLSVVVAKHLEASTAVQNSSIVVVSGWRDAHSAKLRQGAVPASVASHERPARCMALLPKKARWISRSSRSRSLA